MPDKICPHGASLPEAEWSCNLKELEGKWIQAEEYFTYPFRKVCPLCRRIWEKRHGYTPKGEGR